MEEEWICSIWLEGETVNGVEVPCFVLSPCNHKFHTACIVEALRRNGANCPVCRGLPNDPQVAQQNNHNIQIPVHVNQNIPDNNMIEIIEQVRNYNNNNNNNLNINNNQIRNMIENILNNNQNMIIDDNNYNMFRNLIDFVREIQDNNIQPDNYLNYINNNSQIND